MALSSVERETLPLALASAHAELDRPLSSIDPAILPDVGMSYLGEFTARIADASVDKPESSLPEATIPEPADPRVSVQQIGDSVASAFVDQISPAPANASMQVRMAGAALGKGAFQVNDQREILVHVGQVLDLFEDGMSRSEFARLRASDNAGEFVSLERLNAAGINMRYSAAYDELQIETSGDGNVL